jgi:hypothetical protein
MITVKYSQPVLVAKYVISDKGRSFFSYGREEKEGF